MFNSMEGEDKMKCVICGRDIKSNRNHFCNMSCWLDWKFGHPFVAKPDGVLIFYNREDLNEVNTEHRNW